jgi:hypothetical protein
MRRNLARARFIAETAREHSISIGIVHGYGSPGPPSIFVWAPTARTPWHQEACEQSFKKAVRQNLRAIRYIARRP